MHECGYLSYRYHAATESPCDFVYIEKGSKHTNEAWEEELILSQVDEFCF